MVEVTAPDDAHQRTYTVTVRRAAAEKPEPPKASLTAAFEAVPAEHDGKGAFDLVVRFSERWARRGGRRLRRRSRSSGAG